MSGADEARILVFGATGTVGRLVLEALYKSGRPVRAVTRDPAQLPAGIESIAVDLRQGHGLPEALDGIDALFLATPDMDDQASAEIAIVEAAVRSDVRHITKLSAFRAEEEESEIGRTHRAVERLIERSGCSWTFLRPSAFMQNFVTYYLPAMRAGLLRLPCGDAPVNFIGARDIADLAATSLSQPGHGGRAYELYGPEALSYGEATTRVSRALSLRARYEDVPETAYRAEIGSGVTTDRLADLYRYYRSGAASGPPIDLVPILGRPAYTLAEFGAAYRPLLAS